MDKIGESLIGKTVNEVKGKGINVRVVQIDGKYLNVFSNYCPTRYNLVVVGGIITKINSMG